MRRKKQIQIESKSKINKNRDKFCTILEKLTESTMPLTYWDGHIVGDNDIQLVLASSVPDQYISDESLIRLHSTLKYFGLVGTIDFMEGKLELVAQKSEKIQMLIDKISFEDVEIALRTIRYFYSLLLAQGASYLTHDSYGNVLTAEYCPRYLIRNVDAMVGSWRDVFKNFGQESDLIAVFDKSDDFKSTFSAMSPPLISILKYNGGQYTLRVSLKRFINSKIMSVLNNEDERFELYCSMIRHMVSQNEASNSPETTSGGLSTQIADKIYQYHFQTYPGDSAGSIQALLKENLWKIDNCFSTELSLIYEAIRFGKLKTLQFAIQSNASVLDVDIFWFAIERCPKDQLRHVMEYLRESFQYNTKALKEGNTKEHIDALFGKMDLTLISNTTQKNDYGLTPAHYFLIGCAIKSHYQSSDTAEGVWKKLFSLCLKSKILMNDFLSHSPSKGRLAGSDMTTIVAIHDNRELLNILARFQLSEWKKPLSPESRVYRLLIATAREDADDAFSWIIENSEDKQVSDVDCNNKLLNEVLTTILENGSSATLEMLFGLCLSSNKKFIVSMIVYLKNSGLKIILPSAMACKNRRRRLAMLKSMVMFELSLVNLEGETNDEYYIITKGIQDYDLGLVRYYLETVIMNKDKSIIEYLTKVCTSNRTIYQTAVEMGDYNVVGYFDNLIESENNSKTCLRSVKELEKAMPKLKVFEISNKNNLSFSITVDCDSQETAKKLCNSFLGLSNQTIVCARTFENSRRVELQNVQDMDPKILHDFCVEYSKKNAVKELRNDDLKQPTEICSGVGTQQKKKKKKKKKTPSSEVAQNQSISRSVVPYAELVERLKMFTKDVSVNMSWFQKEMEGEIQYCLPPSAGLWVGCLRDYFVEKGFLELSWSEEEGLVLKAEAIYKHLSAHPELLIKANSDTITSVQNLLGIMLSFIRPVLHVLPWKVSASGYVAVVQSRVDNVPQRRKNLGFLLEHIWQLSGLVHDQNTSPWILENKDKNNNSVTLVCVKWSDIRSDELLQLIGNKNKVKELRRIAQAIGNLKRDIVDSKDFQKVCMEVEVAPMPVVTESAQIKELMLPKTRAMIEESDDKKEKNRPKKQSTKTKIATNSTQAHPRPQKKKEQHRKPHIPPQPEERRRDPERIPADKTKVSAAIGVGITMDYFRETSPTKTGQTKSEAEPDSLPEVILQKEHKAWKLLDLLLKKMQKHIQNQKKHCTDLNEGNISIQQQKMVGRFLAGWHYLHAQICNLLRSGYQTHFVRGIIFEHYFYDFERQYQRQKHKYFPPCSLAATVSDFNLCFQDLGALQGALGFIIEGKYPLETSIVLIRKLIADWGNYIEREYTREDRNLREIIKKMSPEEFGEWLFDRVSSSTKHLFQILTEYQDSQDEQMRESIELEMRFVADRIGELLKHIPCYRDQNHNLVAPAPFQRLSAFLDFCRCFRNPSSHTYESGVGDSESDEDIDALQLEEPTLDIEALIKFKETLQVLLSPKAKVGLFSDQKSLARELPRRVRSYKYRNHDSEKAEHDITCLTRLRVNEILKKIPDQKDSKMHYIPFAVSEPILATEKTDLHAHPLINKVCKDLCMSAEKEDQCLLLIPLRLSYDSQDKAPKPVALSMLFKRGANKGFELNKMSFVRITNKRSEVEGTINSLQQKWIEVTHPVNQCEKPREVQIKTLDAAQEKDIGVLQVELLVRLAEQHMHKEGEFSPFPKSSKKKHQSDAERLRGIVRRFRQDHIRLWWLAGMEERYLEQVFIGTSAVEDSNDLDLDPGLEICYKDMKINH